jgi:hypothetical protein
MRAGMSLVQLAQAIEDVENRKKDFLVNTEVLSMADNGLSLNIGDQGTYLPNGVAHRQIAERLKIPKPYYDRMMVESPGLLATNVNHWFTKQPERRLVRTLADDNRGGVARAFLSDSYKFRENYTVAEALLPVIHTRNDLEVMSAEITDTRMYLQLISHNLEGEVKVGEPVKGGIAIRNSEVGLGAFNVSLFIYVLSCTNGMIREHSMKAYHIGKRLQQEFGDNEEALDTTVYSREAIVADSRAFQLKVRDLLAYSFDRTAFDKELEKFRAAAENRMPAGAVEKTIDDVTQRYGMSASEGKGILVRLLEGEDLTQWGLANAVTNIANTTKDYDRAVELESIGGKIIDLDARSWSSITKM